MDVVSTSPDVGGKGKRSRRRIPRTPRASVASPTLPAVTYERTPGAASAPLPGASPSGGIYRRHEPEKTVLYGVVQEHLETFLDQAREPDGDGYPRFVEKEFRRFLTCGLLCHGFARLRCAECGYERLLAFSCKGKLCPSCLARRTADTAAWLVDSLLPEAGYRQWVLTFPYTMRFRLAADRHLLSTLLRVFLQVLFAWQRRRGRDLGIPDGQTGSVSFLQRFGSALNSNVHCHCILPDGLFVPVVDDPSAPLRFVPLPPPTTAEVEELTRTVAGRLTARLAAASEEENDYLDPELAALVEALFWSRDAPPGTRDIPLLPGLESEGREEDGLQGKPLCAAVAGFSLHAAQCVQAHDREALERLLRYGLRAPFSQERLSRRPDGKVVYHLRRPWPHAGGATALVLEPLDVLRRLAALVSFPYAHGVRYHGVFANRSKARKLLPPPPPSRHAPDISGGGALDTAASADVQEHGDSASGSAEPPGPRRRRFSWEQLLRRVLHVEGLACPRCTTAARAVPMIVLALLSDPEVVGKILHHLGLPTTAPVLAPARSSTRALGFGLPEEDAVSGREESDAAGGAGAPGPPIRPPP